MPFNVTECAVLLSLVARLTGYAPRLINYTIGDAHIYENHIEMLTEQLTREPYPAPRLQIANRVPEFYGNSKVTVTDAVEWLARVEPSDFELIGYQHHDAISAPMAV